MMKLYCCFTEAHEVLFRNHFLPTVPADFSVISSKLDIKGAGDFLSPEFLRCICQKIELILVSIRENRGGVIVWSDIDIEFFKLHSDQLLAELGEHDIAFQREGPHIAEVNTGFFVCRCNSKVEAFFELVGEGLKKNTATNEQAVINGLLLDKSLDLDWTHLPLAYYARTHGWPPPKDLILYHANATAGENGVQKKIDQFRQLAFVRRFGFPGVIISCIKLAPKVIMRKLSERLIKRSS